MERLDKELVNRAIVDSRVKAQELIKNNLVKVNGKIVTKTSSAIANDDQIEIVENEVFKYVSRGGFKLEKALDVFNYDVNNKVVMDIGSSTGGFTDCCLQNGASKMICIDVGTDVMHPSLRLDPRVNLYENMNFKDAPSSLFQGVDLAVTDVSFISLKKIFEKISNEKITLDIITLIKPQFECGREIASKYSGVILNKAIHAEILQDLISYLYSLGFACVGLDFSPIKGGDGNIEYLGYFTNKENINNTINYVELINQAFEFTKK